MNTQQTKIIKQVAHVVKTRLEGEGSGHDWWHVFRVWNNAKYIGAAEKADMFVVELTALLHDIADWKLHDGNETIGPREAKKILENLGVAEKTVEHVAEIIGSMSFKGAGEASKMKTLEGAVVQDSDRLDGIGAIGIARAFAYGGHKNRVMYDPAQKPKTKQSKEEFLKDNGSTINHFYEKLLLLKDLLNTQTARKMAEGRHAYMEIFLQQFYDEWNGKR